MSFKVALSSMLDVSLLKDPAFLLIGISNFFGMAALYIPFFYLVDAAKESVSGSSKDQFSFNNLFLLNQQGIDKDNASFLISIIGITNTFARIICGYVSDFPSVDSLFLNNCCLVLGAISVGIIPLCSGFTSYVIAAVLFGLAIGKKLFFSLDDR